MKLFLVQHGEARNRDDDPERSLTEDAIRKTKKIGAWLSRQPVDIAEINHSGKKRAAQTAEIFANRLAPARGSRAVSGLNPNDDVRVFAQQLGEDNDGLMVVGHLPFLDRLAGLLVTGNPERGAVAFVNSGIVCLVGEKEDWRIGWSVVPDLFIES